eukprot:CAMPEP_0168573264 /NCGR_PEP_ID=MMETSP0413-20121227/18429_1 /TAXON_ID=136452 /ORGANISM="Filamoeba nolandi, Strain NC-AS-23-1" /LENGTH=288 /DNA_ID=CAMNT_0008606477 /DNA_START=30 /DNA_END=893 /DNA_ORIENTATION=-
MSEETQNNAGELEDKISDLEAEIQMRKEKQAKLEDNVFDLEEKVLSLEKELKASKEENLAHRNTIDSLKETINTLQQEVHLLKSKQATPAPAPAPAPAAAPKETHNSDTIRNRKTMFEQSNNNTAQPVVEKVAPKKTVQTVQPISEPATHNAAASNGESGIVSNSQGGAKKVVSIFEQKKEAAPANSAEPAKTIARSSTWSPSKWGQNASETCAVCTKVVYLTEKIAADDKIYHKNCFRCAHCQAVLKLGNYAGLDGKFYCKPHFKQLFKTKGNYNEGFGKEKLTTQW